MCRRRVFLAIKKKKEKKDIAFPGEKAEKIILEIVPNFIRLVHFFIPLLNIRWCFSIVRANRKARAGGITLPHWPSRASAAAARRAENSRDSWMADTAKLVDFRLEN